MMSKPWEQARAQLATTAATTFSPNAGGALIASNTATAIASGPEANIVAVFLNGLMQWLKQWPWYNQAWLAFPTLVILGMGIAIGLERDHLDMAIKHGMNYAGQAWINFRSLADGPIMPPGGGA